MPTIPRFHVTQDAMWVFVHVHVPYVRVSEMEFYVDGTHFSFFCKPYLLKLQFPHEVVDDELAKAVYDPNKDHGTIVVHLPKKEPGQEFEDLDMLTKLLQPKELKIDIKRDAKRNAPLIEVLNSSVSSEADDAAAAAEGGAESAGDALVAPSTEPTKATVSLLDLEECIAVTPEEPETVRITNLKPTYGFNNAYSDFFRVWHGEVSEILSLPDPENTPADQRRVLREAAEDEQFDIERYLLDFINKDDDMYYQLAMKYEPFWKQQPVVMAVKNKTQSESVKVIQEVKKSPLIMEVVSSTSNSSSAPENQVTAQMNTLEINGDAAISSSSPPSSLFSEADRELLLRLPHKEYLIERGSKQEAVIFGGLVDILIGFTYDYLTSQGDSGIESTWAVSIVSPTLAWLDTTDDLEAVVRSAVRRILSFPFLRQYDLAIHVLRETVEILKRGKRVVLRALLELHRVVEKSETQYLLNTLYVQDYCVWIQSVKDEQLLLLSERLASHVARFKKADSGWALEEIECSLLEAEAADKKAEAEEEEEEEEEEEDSSEEEEESSSDEESSDDDSSSEEKEDADDDEEKAKENGKGAQQSTDRLIDSISMDGEEIRTASRVSAALPTGDASSWKLKLPSLCARPENLGVQIDSYRTMKVFNRPRCGKFTEHFLGMQFENSSMENYSRVVERTSKRARIVEDRLAKLQAREQEILDDEQNRLRKRHEREVAKQRKIWLHHQSLKKREQRQREQAAASVI